VPAHIRAVERQARCSATGGAGWMPSSPSVFAHREKTALISPLHSRERGGGEGLRTVWPTERDQSSISNGIINSADSKTRLLSGRSSKRKRSGHCAHPVWFTQCWLTLSTAASNLPLAEVVKRAGISLPRVSQIQAEIEQGKLVKPLKGLVERDSYKVKTCPLNPRAPAGGQMIESPGKLEAKRARTSAI